jgi:hypothetical protein
VVGQLTSILILTSRELRVQGTTLTELATALRPWAFGVVALAVGLVTGSVAEGAVAPLAGVVVAATTSMVCFVLVVWTTGGILTISDVRALLDVLPRRVQPVVNPLLRLATLRDGAVDDL